MSQHQNNLDMTFMLGARCRDGVVIAADRKITDLITRSLIGYDEKLYGILRNVILAYGGAVDIFQVYLRYLAGDVIILRDAIEKYTSDNLLHKFTSIMEILRKIRDGYSKDFLLSIMVARQFPGLGMSDLHLVMSNGKYEPVTAWRAIGSGEMTAKDYVNRKWRNNMKMYDFAELSYCIIKYIEIEKLDESVGVGSDRPSIRYLKDGGDLDTQPSEDEYTEFEKSYNEYITCFK